MFNRYAASYWHNHVRKNMLNSKKKNFKSKKKLLSFAKAGDIITWHKDVIFV